jgi:glycosyltransferase involved in cell wall biosynthesis
MNQDKLSVIVPCFNEESTLAACVDRVVDIADETLALEIIIVNDCSTDNSLQVAKSLQKQYGAMLVVLDHHVNMGKGAAIRTGMQHATGDFVAIQDADLEYNPAELKSLTAPLVDGRADVVFGSRYLSGGVHRVLYFWHTMGNKFLTFLSNMFTDLNLTDMETCYKVFRRDKIQDITIQENRFGFEPEIVAKVAQKKLRLYEMGISYDARTYEEGKKIGWRDGLRALYCIFHYNAYRLPLPMQLLIYFFLGGFAAAVNLSTFLLLYKLDVNLLVAAGVSFALAATVNYYLCIHLLFRRNARWSTPVEILFYALFALAVGVIDVAITSLFSMEYSHPLWAKALACFVVFIVNFLGRKFFIFREK